MDRVVSMSQATSDDVCSSRGFLGFKTDVLTALDCSRVSVSTGDLNQNVNDHHRLCAFKAR